MIRKNSILLLIASALLCSCTPLAQRSGLNDREWKHVAIVLERDASADDLITAAMIRRLMLEDSSGALIDLDRTLKLAPKQPDAAWLALSICAETRNCAQAPRSAELLALDPDNAVARYAAMKEARANADSSAEDRALAEMADAEYFDIYWSRLIARGTDALAKPRGSTQRPLRELRLAANEVVGWLASAGIPPFSATSDTCKGDRLKRDEVVEWCRKLAQALDNGDTYIAKAIGRAIAMRVWQPDSVELAKFLQHKREYDYVQQAMRPHADTVANSEQDTQRWLNRYRAIRDEHDVYRAWLIELGIPADPPADWEPEVPKR
jgi:hypothetical protein